MRKSKFYILHFTFYILLILTFLSCSSSTEVAKGDLTGVVNLEGMEDHSGIIIAIYELAELDTTIIRINSQYPHIGVIINQHTEFDHRFQSPIKYTETDIEGNFLIEKIPVGEYNIVALKDSFGFKYIYEFDIEKGENALAEQSKKDPSEIANKFHGSRKVKSKKLNIRENNSFNLSSLVFNPEAFLKLLTLSFNLEASFNLYPLSFLSRRSEAKTDILENRISDLTLYPETHLSGNITEDWVFEPDHHYIIGEEGANSTNFVPGTNLEIQPGAIIRIRPANDLKIYGTISAQGEEDNMFWVTSNDGFVETLEQNYIDSTNYYNNFELLSYSIVVNDIIEWGKFDLANTGLLNQVNNLHMENGIFRNSQCGFHSSLSSINNDSTFCTNVLCYDIRGENDGGIYYLNVNNGLIEKSIIYDNCNGLKVKDGFEGNILNCFFSFNQNGMDLWQFFGKVHNNEFQANYNADLEFTGSTNQIEDNLIIEYNNFYSNTGIYQFGNISYKYYSLAKVDYNNFYCIDYFVKHNSGYCQSINYYYIILSNNYFMNCYNEESIYEKIVQLHPECENRVFVDSFSMNPISNAGIE